jgi:cell division protein FtsN
MNNQQRGGTFLGFVLGLVVGLGVALAVAMYVTKTPTPFSTKSPSRSADQDAVEVEKNKDWNPNGVLQPRALASAPVEAASKAEPAATAPVPAAAASAGNVPTKPISAPAVNADPLGDLMKSKTGNAQVQKPTATEDDLFQYFIQVGAYRTMAEADAQKARMTMMGLDARISEREQAGRNIYRVRLGPFDDKQVAERLRNKLDAASIDNTLVRSQR